MSISLRELISVFFNELKAALKEYVNKQEAALKKRLKKLLIISIVGSVLMALGISLVGSASLFILIGSLKYLSTLMPQWEAWYVMGITSAIVAAILFVSLYLLIRKQLSTPKAPTAQNPQPIQQAEQADINKTSPTN